MLKKLFLTAALFATLSYGGSLTELLNSVRDIVTNYETSGKALEEPYIYTKLTGYYKYGVLYASYGLEKQAVKLLDLAACTCASIDCYAYLYFLTNLDLNSYKRLRKSNPVLLAKMEATYDAYADWWIKKYTTFKRVYWEFKNLENILRYDFTVQWKAFLRDAPKPLYFVIPREEYGWKDRFLVAMLYNAYAFGWIKKITFYGSAEDYWGLIHEGFMKEDVKFVKSDKYPKVDLIEVY